MFHDGNHGYDTVKTEVQTVMDTASGGVTRVLEEGPKACRSVARASYGGTKI